MTPDVPDVPPATAGVVVPIRAFAGGQARLAAVLDEGARAQLGVDLAERVRVAADPRPVIVVSSSPDVRAWALDAGVAEVLDDPGSLDAAAAAGVERCRDLGLVRAVIAHADLPWVTGFNGVVHDASRPVAVAVPCHRDDGTPVLSVPVAAGFRFAYGPGSFRRHAHAARRAGLAWRVVRDRGLGFDVDVPDDLARLQHDRARSLRSLEGALRR
jgi:2-phospho-L-lactate guanylyltransferase